MSTENNTPETDADWESCNFDTQIGCINAANKLVKRARTLERQRDEARRMEKAENAWHERFKRQTEELREESDEALTDRARFEQGAESLTAQLDALRAQRDDACQIVLDLRAELATLRAQSQQVDTSAQDVIRSALENVVARLEWVLHFIDCLQQIDDKGGFKLDLGRTNWYSADEWRPYALQHLTHARRVLTNSQVIDRQQDHGAAIHDAANAAKEIMDAVEASSVRARNQQRVESILARLRAEDAEELRRLTSERDEWRCSALLYHSELRDVAEGRKVETNLAFSVENLIRDLRSQLEVLTQEREQFIVYCQSLQLATGQVGPIQVAKSHIERLSGELEATERHLTVAREERTAAQNDAASLRNQLEASQAECARFSDEIEAVQRHIRSSMDSNAIEGCAPAECVALLASQRDNALADVHALEQRVIRSEVKP